MEPKDVSAWVTAAKGALDLMRSGWQLLPRGDKKDELEINVKKAEEALQISSVTLAKSLDYKLCKCTFPPQIMLWNKEKRTNICSLCGNEDPPQPNISYAGLGALARNLGPRFPLVNTPLGSRTFLCLSFRLTLADLHFRMWLWRRRHEMPDHLLKFKVFRRVGFSHGGISISGIRFFSALI